MNKPSLIISCPIDTYSGYGARARDFVKALINLEKYDVKILPQRWGSTPESFLDENTEWSYLKEYLITQLTYQPDIWIQHSIPNEFQPVGKYNIGLTAGIETTLCRAEWLQGLNKMDLIIGSSNHTLASFKESRYEKKDSKTNQHIGVVEIEKPMEVIFEGIDTNIFKPEKSTFKLNTIKEDFNFLFVGHWMQGNIGEDRKNVGLLVKIFFELFKNNKKAPGLILKTSGGVSSNMDKNAILKKIDTIRKSINAKRLPNIYVVHGDMTNQELNSLYNHKKVKAMISLTKGEGFGRPLLEFSMVKKPIITTGWSGHIDFLDKETSVLLGGELKPVDATAVNDWIIKESKWFNVDLQSCANAIMTVYKDYEVWLRKGKTQGTNNRKNFSLDKMQETIDTVLTKHLPKFAKEVKINLPKLNNLSKNKKELPKLNLPKLEKINNE